MHPVLLRAEIAGHPLVLGSYSTFMVLGWIAIVAVGTWAAHRRGLPWRRTLVVFSASLALGVGGARVLDLATNGRFPLTPLPAEKIALLAQADFTAFALYGGLIAGSLAALALARLGRLPVWVLADSAVPALACGIALMRVGCFLRGCCFGEATDLPWGVTFPPGSPAWAHQVISGQSGLLGIAGSVYPVHPTQLYELAAVLGIAAAATWWRRSREIPDGAAFLAFAMGFTAFRYANGFLRVNLPGASAPAWFYPALYGVVVAACAALLVARFSRHGGELGANPSDARAGSPLPPLPWEVSPAQRSVSADETAAAQAL